MDAREIGDLAVWSVSSAKPGNGVDLLRDGRTDTFWQSDGQQPHLVNIQFQRRVQVTELQLYLDFKLDESYTPQKLALRAGTSMHDLKEVKAVEVKEPSGWVTIQLAGDDSDTEGGGEDARDQRQQPLQAFLLQLAVLSNHQNGRDTHVRQIQVFGPRPDPAKVLGFPMGFTSVEFSSYATVR